MEYFKFNEEFFLGIQVGEKNSTIRQTKRCKVGDTISLIVAKNRVKETTCIGTASFCITEDELWVMSKASQKGTLYPKNQPLHEQEGFKNMDAFMDFFREQYGLPFNGYLHVWEPLK